MVIIQKPETDDRELANDLECVFISDPSTEKASAAIDVKVGHFSDHKDISGLAHFLEHLLFMGTEKFPKENEYSEFLSAHGGYSNAFTGMENTNYYFEVNSSYLEGALDIFSQFFIAPLFLEESTDREMKAVDSEHKKNLQNDNWRNFQLEKDLSNPSHPFSKFGTGNIDTLLTAPKEKGLDLRSILLAFHSKYYSSNIMKLVILGKEPLDKLAEWAEVMFSKVLNKNVVAPTFEGHPMTKNECGRVLKINPVKDSRDLSLIFPLPDTQKEQPQYYLAHLIGHESDGSILSLLKKKGWANSLSASSYYGATNFDFFRIVIQLTEDGEVNYEEIVKIVFQYIKMIEEKGVQEWVFEECKKVHNIHFRFSEKYSVSTYCSNVAGYMNDHFQKEHILCGPTIIQEYDPVLIAHLLSYLRPDNFSIKLVSKTLKVEKWDIALWYKTEYELTAFSEKLKSDLLNISAHPEDLKFPEKNEFLPTRFDVVKTTHERVRHATVLIDTDKARLWYKKDDTFFVPKGHAHFFIRSPFSYTTPAQTVKCFLFYELLKDELNEITYFADVAGVRYDIAQNFHGFIIEIGGYNDKLSVLLKKITEKIRHMEFKEERFNLIKETYNRKLKNWSMEDPYHHSMYYINYLLYEVLWHNDEKLAIIEDIKLEDIKSFVTEIFRNCHIEGFVHGNFQKSEAIHFIDVLSESLNFKPLPISQRFKTDRIHLLPDSLSVVFEEPVRNKNNLNSSIEYYLQIGDSSDIHLKAILDVFCRIVSEPCFDQLRTKEQLGYLVWSFAQNKPGVLGFAVVIQSEKSPLYLESRIENFIKKIENVLNEMKDEEFVKFKEAVCTQLLEKHKSLNQESSSMFEKIKSHKYNFYSAQNEVEKIKPLSKKEIINFYNDFIKLDSKLRKKFSVWMTSDKVKNDHVAGIEGDDLSFVEAVKTKNVFLKGGVDGLCAFKKKLCLQKGASPDYSIVVPNLTAFKILTVEEHEKMEFPFFGTDYDKSDGFIHMSRESQVGGVLKRFFSNQTEVWVYELKLDETRVKFEDAVVNGKTESFPHVYGKLNSDDVVSKILRVL